jgi:pilus assembly protein CpaB
MNTARIVVLAIAIGAGGIAAYLASGSGDKPAPAQPVAQLQTVDILIAKSDIGLGQSVKPDDLQWQTWPAATASSNFISRASKADAIKEITGSIARSPFIAGEPIREQKLVKADGSGFMAAILPAGYRAISTEISPETGAGGFILPNDRVDVILSKREKPDRASSVEVVNSEVILSNIRVLAIAQASREKDGQNSVVGKTATLELKPGQAEALAKARQSGTISLALRSMVDASAPEAPRVEGSTDGLVTVFRGDERSVYSCTPMCKRNAGGG